MPISCARRHPRCPPARLPETHSNMNRTPSLWCGRKDAPRIGSTTTAVDAGPNPGENVAGGRQQRRALARGVVQRRSRRGGVRRGRAAGRGRARVVSRGAHLYRPERRRAPARRRERRRKRAPAAAAAAAAAAAEERLAGLVVALRDRVRDLDVPVPDVHLRPDDARPRPGLRQRFPGLVQQRRERGLVHADAVQPRLRRAILRSLSLRVEAREVRLRRRRGRRRRRRGRGRRRGGRRSRGRGRARDRGRERCAERGARARSSSGGFHRRTERGGLRRRTEAGARGAERHHARGGAGRVEVRLRRERRPRRRGGILLGRALHTARQRDLTCRLRRFKTERQEQKCHCSAGGAVRRGRGGLENAVFLAILYRYLSTT